MQPSTSFIVESPTFIERSQLMVNAGVDRTQLFFEKTRLNVSNLFDGMRTDPQVALYVAQGTLQALDFLTTSQALDAGHRETNPLFQGGNRTSMVVAKAAGFALHVYVVERLAERRPRTAKWLMVATNTFMSIVVAHNAMIN